MQSFVQLQISALFQGNLSHTFLRECWLTGIRQQEGTELKELGFPTRGLWPLQWPIRSFVKSNLKSWMNLCVPQGPCCYCWFVWLALTHQVSESSILQSYVLMISFMTLVFLFITVCKSATVWTRKSRKSFHILNRLSCNVSPQCPWRMWKVSIPVELPCN